MLEPADEGNPRYADDSGDACSRPRALLASAARAAPSLLLPAASVLLLLLLPALMLVLLLLLAAAMGSDPEGFAGPAGGRGASSSGLIL